MAVEQSCSCRRGPSSIRTSGVTRFPTLLSATRSWFSMGEGMAAPIDLWTRRHTRSRRSPMTHWPYWMRSKSSRPPSSGLRGGCWVSDPCADVTHRGSCRLHRSGPSVRTVQLRAGRGGREIRSAAGLLRRLVEVEPSLLAPGLARLSRVLLLEVFYGAQVCSRDPALRWHGDGDDPGRDRRHGRRAGTDRGLRSAVGSVADLPGPRDPRRRGRDHAASPRAGASQARRS